MVPSWIVGALSWLVGVLLTVLGLVGTLVFGILTVITLGSVSADVRRAVLGARPAKTPSDVTDDTEGLTKVTGTVWPEYETGVDPITDYEFVLATLTEAEQEPTDGDLTGEWDRDGWATACHEFYLGEGMDRLPVGPGQLDTDSLSALDPSGTTIVREGGSVPEGIVEFVATYAHLEELRTFAGEWVGTAYGQVLAKDGDELTVDWYPTAPVRTRFRTRTVEPGETVTVVGTVVRDGHETIVTNDSEYFAVYDDGGRTLLTEALDDLVGPVVFLVLVASGLYVSLFWLLL
ncbi:hypothetical protein BRC81_12600 [Halobacteriales archaeon QS_1_68_20]|nr:MAG: hypothetical protein BRC81_12600 [Halobacteriales archaeon QS_1_68_20]